MTIGTRGMWTRWGAAQQVENHPTLPICSVSTAGHGGYVGDGEWARANLSTAAIEASGVYGHGGGERVFFEEDCDWAILYLECEDVARWRLDVHNTWMAEIGQPLKTWEQWQAEARETVDRWCGHYTSRLATAA